MREKVLLKHEAEDVLDCFPNIRREFVKGYAREVFVEVDSVSQAVEAIWNNFDLTDEEACATLVLVCLNLGKIAQSYGGD